MIEIKRNGKVFYTLEDVCDGSKLSRQLMDHHYVILKFTTVEPVYFEIGDSVEIADFGYFELTSAYFPKSSDGGYEYELQMDAYYMAWKNKICKYRPQYGANETSFKLTTKISVHANVILSNLKALGYQYNGKDYSVDFSTYNKDVFDVEKRFLVEYDSISIIDAITTIAETLECEWWIDGSIIYFGYCEMVGQVTFEQGKNVLSMSYSESKADYITRLYAFGSDKNIPKGYFTGSETDVTTDGIATDYLMLPTQGEDEDGFVSKDGYLENVNVVKNPAQAIEGVVMFDDEYPRVVCAVSSIKTYDSTVKNDDGTTTTQTFWQVTSDDSFAKSFEKAWIKENLTLMIKFTSGMLLGMEFEVSYKVINNVNYFEIVANDTYGRTLPDNALYPKYGDKFFLYNWDATKITETDLIQKAQMSLLERSKTYYKKSMISNANFDCEMDAAEFYNGGIYNYHPLGEQVKLINPMFADVDKEGKHYRNSRIIGMDIKLDIPYDAPTYVVGERPSYSKLGQLEDKVDSITVNGKQIGGTAGGNGVYVIGLNDSTPATDSNVYSARRARSSFLSKLYDDIAKGFIVFEEGISIGINKVYNIFKNGVAYLRSLTLDEGLSVGGDTKLGENGTSTTFGDFHADSTGARIAVQEDGTSTAEFDYITIRRAAEFREITIRELKHIGGELAISAAAMVCSKVEPLDGNGEVVTGESAEVKAYRCYFDTSANDEGKQKVFQQFKVGDQARCQQFDIEVSSEDGMKHTRYYWRLVTAVGNNYIVLSDVDKDSHSTSEPQAGDNIVQLGYRYESSPNRQSAIILSATSDDAPSTKHYQGINNYSLDHLVKDEGYDATSGAFHSNVYGNSYVGDKGGKGFFSYDAKSKTATFKGIAQFLSDSLMPDGETKLEDLPTRKDLEGLNIRSGNLLRNTAFSGDYESADVSDDTEISEDTETFSEKLKYWTVGENTSILDSNLSNSGKMASIGLISQTLDKPLLDGEQYTLSFYGRGTLLVVTIGDSLVLKQQLTGSHKRYELHFTNQGANSVISFSSDHAFISDIMLTYGTLAPAWSPAYADNDKSVAQFQNIKYLLDAITQGSTTIDGGLAMTQQIKVGNYRDKQMIKETGGMSGYYNDEQSPFLWGGGSLEQAIRTIQYYKDDPTRQPSDEELKDMAMFVVTHGGRAILSDIVLRGIIYAEGGVMKSIKSPNGKFQIDEEGNAKLDGEINATKGTIGGFDINRGYLGTAIEKVEDEDGKTDIGLGRKDKMTLMDQFIVFNGENRQAIIGQWESLGTSILARLYDHVDDILERFGMVLDVRNKKGDACALYFGGGYTSGLSLKTMVYQKRSNGDTPIDRSVGVALLLDENCTYQLPDMYYYDDGHLLFVKRIDNKEKQANVTLKVGKYIDQNGKEETPYILCDRGAHESSLTFGGPCDAMTFIFTRQLYADGVKGCWVQFKNPRDW